MFILMWDFVLKGYRSRRRHGDLQWSTIKRRKLYFRIYQGHWRRLWCRYCYICICVMFLFIASFMNNWFEFFCRWELPPPGLVCTNVEMEGVEVGTALFYISIRLLTNVIIPFSFSLKATTYSYTTEQLSRFSISLSYTATTFSDIKAVVLQEQISCAAPAPQLKDLKEGVT